MTEYEQLALPAERIDPLQQTILDLLRAGNTRKTAREMVGAAPATFQRWIDENQTFRAAVMVAEAQAEADYTTALRTAALGGQLRKRKIIQFPDGKVVMEEERTVANWRAAVYWLDRRKWEWRETKPIDVKKLSDDQIIRLLETMEPEAEDGEEDADAETAPEPQPTSAPERA